MKPTLPLIAAVAALAGSAGAATPPAKPAPPFVGQELATQAKVDLRQAQAIAAHARPGQITAQELEKEPGGSGLRYAFDITSQGRTYEVGVDARTGKVLENAVESAAQEAREAKAEAAVPPR